MADDEFRAGEALAFEWLEGKTSLTGDLAILVVGMARELRGDAHEFGGEARGFLVTVGNAARQAANGTARPAPAGAPKPTEVQPSPSIDLAEFLRQRREREQAARIEDLWRQAASPPLDCGIDSGRGQTW